jgi:hypothetical protein
MKKTGKKTKPEIKPAGRFCERVPADHPIYKSGYVVGGTYPARKTTKPSEESPDTILELLEKVGDESVKLATERVHKLAVERNADPADEDIQRDAVFQAAADRARAKIPPPTGLAAQLSATIDQMMAEADDETTRKVLKKFQSNLAGKRPLTASQLAKRYGLEPTTIANLKASQAKLAAIGRDLTLEEVYVLESNDSK